MSVVIPIFKRDVMNYEAYRGVKLLEHAMKIVESVLESRIRLLVYLDEMQFGFMPGKETTDAFFLICRIEEEYSDTKENPCTCALLIWKRNSIVSQGR